MRDTATDDIVKISIPAPVESMFNNDQTVTSVAGAAIATAMSTATGKTLSFTKGKLWRKPGKTA